MGSIPNTGQLPGRGEMEVSPFQPGGVVQGALLSKVGQQDGKQKGGPPSIGRRAHPGLCLSTSEDSSDIFVHFASALLPV